MAVTQSNGLNRGVSDPAVADTCDTDNIRQDIDRTRSAMDRTIDELSERLRPRNLFDDLVDSVRCSVFGGGNTTSASSGSVSRQRLMADEVTDVAGRAGRTLLEAVRENPVPAALMGAGLAWLLFEDKAERAYRRQRILANQRGYTGNRFTDPGTHSGSYVDARTGKPYDASYGAGYADLDHDGNPDVCPPSMMDKARSAASSVKETLGSAAHAVGSAAHTVGDVAGRAVEGVKSLAGTVGHAASATGQGLRSAGQTVGEYGRTAGSTLCETGSSVADYSRSAASSVADYSQSVADYSRSAASSVADYGRTAASSVADFGHTAADSMRTYGRKAGQGISTGVDFSKERFDRALNDKPLAVGAAALAAGVLVGFALPRTRTEDEMCGDVSDRLKDQARRRGEELLDQGKEAASHLADTALGEAEGAGLTPGSLGDKIARVAKDALSAAQQSAEREGIAPGAIADKAMQVASAVKEKGKEELKDVAKDVAPASLTGETGDTAELACVTAASASLGPSDLGSAGGGDMSAVTEGPEAKREIAEGMSASSGSIDTVAGALSDDLGDADLSASGSKKTKGKGKAGGMGDSCRC